MHGMARPASARQSGRAPPRCPPPESDHILLQHGESQYCSLGPPQCPMQWPMEVDRPAPRNSAGSHRT
ncbi:MAG: hypothetical protein ACK55I_49610 [bacterium]